jgi:hypothetical protein
MRRAIKHLTLSALAQEAVKKRIDLLHPRRLIQRKLDSGRLPVERPAIVIGHPGKDREICEGCTAVLRGTELVGDPCVRRYAPAPPC